LNNRCKIVAPIRLLDDENFAATVSFINSDISISTRRPTVKIEIRIVIESAGNVSDSSVSIANYNLRHVVNRSAPFHRTAPLSANVLNVSKNTAAPKTANAKTSIFRFFI
jgi:hypothetical protein